MSSLSVQDIRAYLEAAGLFYVSGPVPSRNRGSCILFSVVRNEILRLPYLLEYYRALGISHFVVADNASDDGTAAYLESQADVGLFRAPGSYAESRCSITWLNALLQAFGEGNWCLSVDADEMLVYPHCERQSLPDLAASLTAKNCSALPCFLLDMYSAGPISEAQYQQGSPFLAVCPYFDTDGYSIAPSEPAIPFRGGPRQRLFWDGRERPHPAPYLAKTPFVFWTSGCQYEASTHTISMPAAAPPALSGALLHFKLFSDFIDRSEEEAARAEHFNAGAQYHVYWEVFQENPKISAFHQDSVRYEHSMQLVALGLMKDSPLL